MNWRALTLGALMGTLMATPLWAAECIDVSSRNPIELSGRLSHRVFPGPPNYEDVQKGDLPESAYILNLIAPQCFSGDEFLEDKVNVSQVHLIVSGGDDRGLFASLRERIGQLVTVIGNEAFGAHTGHQHAPVLLIVRGVSNRPEGSEAGMTTVQAFYSALAAGDGWLAAQYIIPAKRRYGPLSAAAMSSFYGSLKRPLKLIDVSDLGGGRYRAAYSFETDTGRCEGTSVVRTVARDEEILIGRIVAENGC